MSSTNNKTVLLGDINHQSGYGIPNHISPKGSIYIDLDTATEYINKDGLVDWQINSGGAASGLTLTQNQYDAITGSSSPSSSNVFATIADLSSFTGSTQVSGDYLPLSGGTVTGDTYFTIGLTANTISASTYYGLPTINVNENQVAFGSGTSGTISSNSNFSYDGTNAAIGGVSATTDSKLFLYSNTNIPLLIKNEGWSNSFEIRDFTNTPQIYIDYTNQLAFNAGAYGPIYFGSFYNPSAGLAGFSKPGEVFMAVSAQYSRMGVGGGGVYFAVNNPSALLEVKGKANEVQLKVTAFNGQTNDIVQVTDESGLIFSIDDLAQTKLHRVYADGTNNGTTKLVGIDSVGKLFSTTASTSGSDTYITGGTYNNLTGTATFTNNTGGTFSVTGFSTSTATEFTGGTVTGETIFTGGLSANTISASTYYGINTQDTYTTGGTYSNGTAIFTNNTGGTFSVSGFSTGYTLTSSEITNTLGYTPLSAYTDTYITGSTYSNNTFTFTNNTGGTFSTSFNDVTGLTVNGVINITQISGGTPVTALALDVSGNVITGNTTSYDPRVMVIASSALPSYDVSLIDELYLTALATNINFSGLTGTTSIGHGKQFIANIKDNGVGRTITWGPSFANKYATLPTTTTANKGMAVGLKYNTGTTQFDCWVVSQEP